MRLIIVYDNEALPGFERAGDSLVCWNCGVSGYCSMPSGMGRGSFEISAAWG